MRFLFAAREEGGIALITALLTLLVLSSLTASFVLVSQTEIWGTSNYKTVTQSRYLAEAGAERTLEWLRRTYVAPSATYTAGTDGALAYNSNPVQLSAMDGYTSNFPSSTMTDSFYSTLHNQTVSATGISGTYSSRALLLDERTTTSFGGTPGSSQMWRIISQGNIAGVRNAVVEVQEIIERRGVPVFNYGLYATGTVCDVIKFSGGDGITYGIVDSWDSSHGTYAATKQLTDGDIGANGGVSLSSSGTIWGTLSTPMADQTTHTCSNTAPNALELSGTGSVKETEIKLGAPLTFENPAPITPAPPTTDLTISSACDTTPGCTVIDATAKIWSLAPGTYGNIKMSGGTLIFNAGTYNINGITQFSGGSTLQIDSGPVRVNVQGTGSNTPLSMSGGSIANTTGLPSNLAIVYGGSGAITLSGASGSYLGLYAPNAALTISGNGDIYGGIITKTLVATGGSSIHFDGALRNTFTLTFTWKPISISRSKY